MGLDTASVLFFRAAKSLGVDFTRTMMIGRQTFCPAVTTLARVFATLGIAEDAAAFLRDNRFSEQFFCLLGSKEITSLDYSDYEQATVQHDMNTPIPDNLRGRFSLVHDGGTIEHVFNIYQALKNCMEMVAVGGHFTQVNVANNYMGHGFWQFSPEMIFRAFSPANGYEIIVVLLHEVVPGGSWYVVTDPEEVKTRVELCNALPTYILTVAKRTARVEIFGKSPQQSDYSAIWDRGTNPQPAATRAVAARPQQATGIVSMLKRLVPGPVKRRLRRNLVLENPFDRPYYRRVSEEDLLRGELV